MQESQNLNFQPVTWKDYDRIYPYTSAYGEGSCQHSPVSMASLEEKYGDAVCMRDGFMYTLRSRLCDDEYRVYLAPLGSGDVAEAFRRIFDDAGRFGKKVKFVTLTQKYAILLQEAFPDLRKIARYIDRARLQSRFFDSHFLIGEHFRQIKLIYGLQRVPIPDREGIIHHQARDV